MTDMRLNGDGHSNIRCTDALLPFESYNDLHESSFDIVMTNPPFGSVLTNEAQNYIGKFELQSQTSKIALEIVGLERCIQFLRENGKLAIVLPDSIFVNPSLEKVRTWITTKVDVYAVISLPIETFSPFGANIKTSILFAKKTSSVIQGEVFMGELENIGYDSSGRSSDINDIPMVEDELLSFLNKRGW
jgi:type I restriction enzyme M protein